MKQVMAFVSSSMAEFIGLILLLVLYGWVAQSGSFLTDQQLYILEFVNRLFDDNALINIFWIKVIILIILFITLLVFYTTSARLFHGGVAPVSTAFMLATWGFFSNSNNANGAMFFLLLVLSSLLLFFHWFDSAFRSKTYAKSLCAHFVLLGTVLGLAFCTYGIPGLMFPVSIMLLTLLLSRKEVLLKEIRYNWLLIPLAIIVLGWTVIGIFSAGFIPFLSSLFKINPDISYAGEPFVYLLPLIIFLVPALLTKDIWARAVVSYHKTLYLLIAWIICGFIFLFLFSSFHQAFSLLIITPLIIWLGFYLGEVFRNPVIPVSIKLVLDSMTLIGLILSICFIILTFQIVPSSMQGRLIIVSFALPLISIILLCLRDITISRVLPLYVVPSALLLCILAQTIVIPIVRFKPAQELYPLISAGDFKHSHGKILEWQSEQAISSIKSNLPLGLRNKVVTVNNQITLESMIQTREGLLYLIVPETTFYNLPFTVRDMGSIVGVSWQWKQPLTVSLCIEALKNEMLDFDALSEPVFLLKISALSYPQSD